MEDMKKLRQWGSHTPGHPENFVTKGVEVTTGESETEEQVLELRAAQIL